MVSYITKKNYFSGMKSKIQVLTFVIMSMPIWVIAFPKDCLVFLITKDGAVGWKENSRKDFERETFSQKSMIFSV
jgi:hypothetical protein